MVQIVNGYACNNSADIALARRGIAPGGPKPIPSGDAMPKAPASVASAGQSGAPQAGTARAGRGSLIDLIA